MRVLSVLTPGRICYCGVLSQLIAVFLPLVLAPSTALSQFTASTFHTGPMPPWVQPIIPESNAKGADEQDKGGEFLRLIDSQVNSGTQESFMHIVKQIVTEAGVQHGANLEFDWDPSYQELTVHQITIQRGQERIDRLDPAKFRIIQQETDLNRQIYNGTLSALLFLDDVRVGDEIEYTCTVRGVNPSLKGRYAESFLLGSTSPIGRRRVRVLWPEGRTMHYRSRGTDIAPEISSGSAVLEYVWDVRDVPAVNYEDQTPAWFPSFPWIQLSEYPDWAGVASWAAGLYPATNAADPAIAEELFRLRRPNATAEQSIQAALEFAQNEIRYLGIEFGPGSYRPCDPATVLRRRFGDCKDKAFLFCTLVRGLGYDADPVLVGTHFRQTLSELLPSPYDFDHVIVRVRAEGRTYWLDPTRPYQRGPIGRRFLPDYGFGLVAREGETELCAIPCSNSGAPATYTTEVFRIGGQKAPAELTLTTAYQGYDAEWMRAVLAAEGREKLARSYLNDYAQRYPGIQPKTQIEIDDATNADDLRFTQTYSISNFWVLSSDKQQYRCEFYPLGIHSWVTKPAAAARHMPLELFYPRLRSVFTMLELPRDFKLSNSTNLVKGPGAELRFKREFRGRKVWLTYEYQALTNFIPVSLAAAHMESLERMENALGYSLHWQNGDTMKAGSQTNWPVSVLAMLYTSLLCAGAVMLYRRQGQLAGVGEAGPAPLPSQPLTGLGGWLVLVGIGLTVSSVRLLVAIVRSSPSFGAVKWHALTHAGGVSYHPLWGPILIFELLGQLTTLALAIMALLLFFQKRRLFPRLFIGLLVFNALFVIADTIGVQLLNTGSSKADAAVARNLFAVAIGCSIWIPYMLQSRRVKATFVR